MTYFLRGVCVEMEGGGGCGVGGGGGGGYLHEVTEEKVIDGIVHPFACRAWHGHAHLRDTVGGA